MSFLQSPTPEIQEDSNEFINEVLLILENRILKSSILLRKNVLDNKIANDKKDAASIDKKYEARKEKWGLGDKAYDKWADKEIAKNDFLLTEQCAADVFFKATHAVKFKIEKKEAVSDSFEHCQAIPLHAKTKDANQRRLLILSTSAKNRAEFLTDQADFYPIFIALLGALVTYLALTWPEQQFVAIAKSMDLQICDNQANPCAHTIKKVLTLFGFIFTLPLIYSRLQLKKRIAELKMIGGILDLVDKQFPKATSSQVEKKEEAKKVSEVLFKQAG